VLFTKYCADQTKGNEIKRKIYSFFEGDPEGRKRLGNLGLYGKIILKHVSKK